MGLPSKVRLLFSIFAILHLKLHAKGFSVMDVDEAS